MFVVPTPSRQLAAKNWLNHTSPQNWILKLYTNDYTPVVTSTAANFTEASGGGYTSKTLTGSSWTITDDGVDDALATYAQQVWSFSGALSGSATVYGVFAVQASSGLLLGAERAPNPFTPATSSDQFGFTPNVRVGDLVP